MSEELETCPKCKKGKVRPIGKDPLSGQATEPLREDGNMRQLKCDNPDCDFTKYDAGN